jgi:excisionase family DNA binding protein
MDFFTPRELSQRFKVSERQITHLARIGTLPAIKIGRLWRFPVKGIEGWEAAQGFAQEEINALVSEIVEEAVKGKR